MRLAPARIRASSCGDQPVGTRVEARGPTTGRVAMRKEAEMLGRSAAARPGGTAPGSAAEDRRSAAEMTLLTIVGDSARVDGIVAMAESVHSECALRGELRDA